MIAIILGILQWIGIVLVALLCILLFLVCLVLFVPIRYSFYFKRTGVETDPAIEVKGKVSWLLSFVRVILRYPADVYVKAKIFLATVFSIPENKKKESRKKEKNKKHRKDSSNHGSWENETGDASNVLENNETGDTAEDLLDEKADQVQNVNPAEKKTSLIEKIKKIPETIQNVIEKLQAIREKIESGQMKTEAFCEKAEYYQKVLESNTFREAFVLCKKELLGILKSISPKKIDVYLEIGLEDPATTATILSYYGMLYPWIYDKVRIVGNFEEIIIKTNGTIKGKIRIVTILLAGIRVYFNKNIRKLLRIMKKGGTS